MKNPKDQRGVVLIFVVFIIVLVALGAVVIRAYNVRHAKAAINSFEECKAAGYPIMESYPEQCAVPGGKSFTNSSQRAQ